MAAEEAALLLPPPPLSDREDEVVAAVAADLARLDGSCEAAELRGRETEGVGGQDSRGQQLRWKRTAEGGRKCRSGSAQETGMN